MWWRGAWVVKGRSGLIFPLAVSRELERAIKKLNADLSENIFSSPLTNCCTVYYIKRVTENNTSKNMPKLENSSYAALSHGEDEKKGFKILVKTGWEEEGTELRSATIRINNKSICQILTPEETPESEKLTEGNHRCQWRYAVYYLSIGMTVTFTATATGKEPIVNTFTVGDIDPEVARVYGHKSTSNRDSERGGWIVSLDYVEAKEA